MPTPAHPPIVVSATVYNAHGIHCRPSAVIARAAQEHPDNDFRVVAPNGETDLRSVIGLIGLGIECNTQITIEVAGPQQHDVAARFRELFETHFDFPPRDSDPNGVPELD